MILLRALDGWLVNWRGGRAGNSASKRSWLIMIYSENQAPFSLNRFVWATHMWKYDMCVTGDSRSGARYGWWADGCNRGMKRTIIRAIAAWNASTSPNHEAERHTSDCVPLNRRLVAGWSHRKTTTHHNRQPASRSYPERATERSFDTHHRTSSRL